MNFTKINISGWRQFANIEIEFNSRVTVLTGANGCGKTTLLNFLASHNNWNFTPLASPREDANGVWKFFTNIFKRKAENTESNQSRTNIGSIEYLNKVKGNIYLPDDCGTQYSFDVENRQNVPLIYIPSHRPIFKYTKIDNIPTNKKSARQASDEVANSTRDRYFGHGHNANQSHLMKNILIGWAINGYGVRNQSQFIMPPDNEQISYFEGFQKILNELLPDTLGFERIEIRNMEIVLICHGGKDDFMLESVSGGIGAIIDLAWQIFMYGKTQDGTFTVLIDEVENHLHPTMQRRVLPDLVKAFPNANFIVSTHSPLIVNSVNTASVYVLLFESGKYYSKSLDFTTAALEANEILENVLGISSSLSIQTENELKQILSKYMFNLTNEDQFDKFRKELKNIGLERLVPKYLKEVL